MHALAKGAARASGLTLRCRKGPTRGATGASEKNSSRISSGTINVRTFPHGLTPTVDVRGGLQGRHTAQSISEIVSSEVFASKCSFPC
jgi:hypothetical protein